MLSIAIFLLFLLLFTALAELSPAKPINLSRASRSTVFHHNLGMLILMSQTLSCNEDSSGCGNNQAAVAIGSPEWVLVAVTANQSGQTRSLAVFWLQQRKRRDCDFDQAYGSWAYCSNLIQDLWPWLYHAGCLYYNNGIRAPAWLATRNRSRFSGNCGSCRRLGSELEAQSHQAQIQNLLLGGAELHAWTICLLPHLLSEWWRINHLQLPVVLLQKLPGKEPKLSFRLPLLPIELFERF